jgi:hypothetical protein
MEDRLDPRREVVGYHGLGDPISDRRNSQHPNSPARLRNVHGLHRRREVAARAEPIPDLVEIVAKIFLELSEADFVHTGCALVLLTCRKASHTCCLEISNDFPSDVVVLTQFLPQDSRLIKLPLRR